MRRALLLAVPLGFSVGFAACSERRESSASPTWNTDVGAIFASRCTSCHGASSAGWRATSYLAAIACTDGGAPVTLPASADAPILRALGDATHQGAVSPAERAVIAAWVEAGTPKIAPGVHDPSFVDPRSPESHGNVLREKRWRPMLDASDPEACARCHDGVGSPRPDGVTASAPGATSCTTCHTEPAGVLACGTCHGDGAARAFPPRDPCFFPDDRARGTAHAAHVESSPSRAAGLACTTCHPVPDAANVIGGAHGDGVVEVAFDPAIAAGAAYDATSGVCTTSCHARPGAARPRPSWNDEGPLGCNGCHGAPPPAHYAGPCGDCHREANADGTALASPTLHVNGKIDLGDGSGECGACHGRGDDPWPKTNAHASHRAPQAAAAAPCETCHVVPTAFGTGAGHPRGGPARVTFGGRALANGSTPAYTAGACTSTYCHGAATPAWADTSGKAKACGACHGIPPAPPHVASPSCDTCHSPVVMVTPSGPVIVPSEAELHVNGEVDRGP